MPQATIPSKPFYALTDHDMLITFRVVDAVADDMYPEAITYHTELVGHHAPTEVSQWEFYYKKCSKRDIDISRTVWNDRSRAIKHVMRKTRKQIRESEAETARLKGLLPELIEELELEMAKSEDQS